MQSMRRIPVSESTSIFATPHRFLRAAHVIRDFDRSNALDGYVVTSTIERARRRIMNGLALGGERAWRLTGDYGTGKSSFALYLAKMLSRDQRSEGKPMLLPVLVVGEWYPIEDTIREAITRTLSNLTGDTHWVQDALASLPSRVEDQLSHIARAVAQQTPYTGLLLVLDELGKFLEYAAARHRDRGIYVLQQVADIARCHEPEQIVVLGLLHQGVHAYADRLPSTARREWVKVAGRFEEIVLNQAVAEQVRLTTTALGVDQRRVAERTAKEGENAMRSLIDAGWYGAVSKEERAELVQCSRALYPVHPTVLPVLIRICALFGQHERSLFEFLLASTPFGLQAWVSSQGEVGRAWYRLSNLFDYIRHAYAHDLSDQRTILQWGRISQIVDASQGQPADALELLKGIGLLNALDADDLRPTQTTIALATGLSKTRIENALSHLRSSGRLYTRGRDGGFRLWPASSVSLDQAFATAAEIVSAVPDVAEYLTRHSPSRPIVARRHYIRTGTLRHFYCEYVTVGSLGSSEVPRLEDAADGRLLIVLCSTEADRDEGVAFARQLADPQTLVGVSDVLDALGGDILDVERWQWIIKHVRELSDDQYAQAEAERQLSSARSRLQARTDAIIGLDDSQRPDGLEWFCEGESQGRLHRKDLLALVSDTCDRVFSSAPLVTNELLNRDEISSSAAKARGLLIERIFEHETDKNLGMNDHRRAPPEKAVYLSVLRSTGLHVQRGENWVFSKPEPPDLSNFGPTFAKFDEILEARGTGGAHVPAIIEVLRHPPFGIRQGLIPLVLALYMRLNRTELAVYEDGSFALRPEAGLLQRLTKVPSAFRFQLCRVQGPRAAALRSLADLLTVRSGTEVQNKLLDVVTHLCVFAAQLPTYTKHTRSISDRAQQVRRVLLAGREPATLLFEELPNACDLNPLSTTGASNEVVAYAKVLGDVCDELESAYPRLLDRLRSLLYQALEVDAASSTARSDLNRRARGVAAAVREPKLTAFSARISDDYHEDGDQWIAAIAAIVRAQPPDKWRDSDEASFERELLQIASRFLAVEQIGFAVDRTMRGLSDDALLTVIDSQGVSHQRVVRVGPDERRAVEALAARLQSVVDSVDKRLVLAAVARLAMTALSDHCDGET